MARFWLLGSALVETLLFSGCLLGWNSLSPILTEEGVLATGCQTGPPSLSPTTSSSLGIHQTFCTSQEHGLHLGFSVGSAFLGCTFLPLQLLLGYAQMRSLRQIGGALVSVALLMLAYSCTNPRSLSLFLPFAVVGLGVGGSCVLFTSLMLPVFLQNARPLYTSLVIACFTASATVFTLIKVIYSFGVPIVPLILGYGALSCLMFVNSFFHWTKPKQGSNHSGDGKELYGISLRLHCYDVLKKKKPEEEEEEDWCQRSLKHKFQESLRDKERILSRSKKLDFRKPEVNASAGPPLQRSLLSATFLLHLACDSLLLTWLHFYISSLNLHLGTVTEHPETAGNVRVRGGGVKIWRFIIKSR
uniref:Uncharacterized protein n=1 Tax=Leptobrachium leishanense TaxID=445787 RepID=A0A8C5PYG6_9ANUR